jgi:RNA polymerase sigma-70 factor (ECF subfamily)
MAKHHLINTFRANARQPVYEDYVDYEEKISIHDTSDMEYREFVMELKKAIQTLPPTTRKVVVLSKINQLSNKEIAEQLKLSDHTVRNSLSLGLKKLKETLNRADFPCVLLFVKVMDFFGTN